MRYFDLSILPGFKRKFLGFGSVYYNSFLLHSALPSPKGAWYVGIMYVNRIVNRWKAVKETVHRAGALCKGGIPVTPFTV